MKFVKRPTANQMYYYNAASISETEQLSNSDFDYIMSDFPNNLVGIQSLWHLIAFNKNMDVIAKALEFLNHLHTVLSSPSSPSPD